MERDLASVIKAWAPAPTEIVIDISVRSAMLLHTITSPFLRARTERYTPETYCILPIMS